ncbi:MAG: hypothetical protein PWP64_1077 [Candidatus Cloacimonadota bacterium]|nr:hypothetical protein [Candidatus Cloacimonadota bacterium]
MKENITDRSWVEIDLSTFRSNLRILKDYLRPGQSFLQIVKADAYGHGAKEIAEIALAEGAKYLGVANAEEGKLLRIQNIQAPILILSPSLISEIPKLLKYKLTPSVSDADFASALSQKAQAAGVSCDVHLKLDTGMHRSGIYIAEAMAFYQAVAALQALHIEGIFSHFASAESDPEFSHQQESALADFIHALAQPPRYVHIANSAGLINAYGSFCNLVRWGICSYGVNISTGNIGVQPVMTFKSTLSQIKPINPGDTVGYEREWTAAHAGRYGIIPVGYADGYDFLLSNRAVVLIRGSLCPVIGRISMDMITVDLSKLPQAELTDEVILLGEGHEEIRVERLAGLYHGSAYELLCQVGRRAKRYYRSQDRVLHSTPLARRDFVSSDFGDSKLNQIITSALTQRLDSEEIGELIYREILRTFFYNKDRNVHYRKNFQHEISFATADNPMYYVAKTRLRYQKILDKDTFIVACASSNESLRAYFMRPDVEYRWLLDARLLHIEDSFFVDSVRINDIDLQTQCKNLASCQEILCFHPKLKKLVGQEVAYEINTTTLYPTAAHQFSVFISELTRGVKISFSYPPELGQVEPVSIFSGQQKNPQITQRPGKIQLKSQADEWVFPLSGVVFSY